MRKIWLTFNWNANGYYNQIDATRLGYGRHRSTFFWSTLLNANFTPVRHYTVQLNARFRGATLVPQGRRESDCRINLGMKYYVPAINLSLLGSVTDLLDTYRKTYTPNTPELIISLKSKSTGLTNEKYIFGGAGAKTKSTF